MFFHLIELVNFYVIGLVRKKIIIDALKIY